MSGFFGAERGAAALPVSSGEDTARTPFLGKTTFLERDGRGKLVDRRGKLRDGNGKLRYCSGTEGVGTAVEAAGAGKEPSHPGQERDGQCQEAFDG
jgi:hypothetical protein